jgi:hypothetical protein
MESGAPNRAMLVFEVVRLFGWLRSAANGFGKGLIRILNFESDVAHAVTVFSYVIRGNIVGRQRRRQNEIRLALRQGVGSPLPLTGLQPAVCDLRKTEPLAIKICGLPRVAYPKFNMMNSFELEWILHRSLLPAFHLRILGPAAMLTLVTAANFFQ